MKKLIGTVAVAALLATAAFAEGLSFGVWGRALWVVESVKDDAGDNAVTSGLVQSWGGPSPRVGLGVSGSSENLGFKVDLHANGRDGIILGDNCLAWAKPIEMLKIQLAAKDDTNLLRSDAAYGIWDWHRIGTVSAGGHEGVIFPALLNKNVSVVVTPIEGLTVGYGFDVAVGDPSPKADSDRLVDQIGRTSGFAAAYKINNIGRVLVGFKTCGKGYDKEGGYKADRKDKFEADAAFELTMLEKVYAAVGAQIPLGGTFGKYDEKTWLVANESPVNVSLFTKLSLVENLAINVLAQFKLNSKDVKEGSFKSSGQFGFRFSVEGEYNLSNGIGFFAQVDYANGIFMSANSGDNMDCITFGLGAKKALSGGMIGIAFEGATNGYGAGGSKVMAAKDDFHWEVPIKLEYGF